MRNSILNLSAIAAVLILSACGNKTAITGEAGDVAEASKGSATYSVNTNRSSILWRGSKVVGLGEHKGTISLKQGEMNVLDGMIHAGTFVIDMNSIHNTDLADAEQKAMLEGHLKADDFFNVEKYPTGKFEISKIEAKAEGDNTHIITGNLTLRGVTKSISFPARIDVNEAGLVANASVTINRLDWGINYDKEKMSLSEAAQQSAKNGIVSKDIQLDIKIQAAQ